MITVAIWKLWENNAMPESGEATQQMALLLADSVAGVPLQWVTLSTHSVSRPQDTGLVASITEAGRQMPRIPECCSWKSPCLV